MNSEKTLYYSGISCLHSMGIIKFRIITKNLLLVPISMDYAEDIFREFTPAIAFYMFPQPYKNIDETINSIQSAIKTNNEGSNLKLVVLSRTDETFLGCASINGIDTDTPEFGIWIKQSAHGNAYGKEAIFALKKWADENLHYRYLLYPVADTNLPSRRIPESLGGVVAREYDDANKIGKILHCLEYRIYPDETETTKEYGIS